MGRRLAAAVSRHQSASRCVVVADRDGSSATVGLTHDVLGQLAIFTVPIARDERRTRYQAIFT